MAKFNLGPHPRMTEILNNTPGLELAVPLTDFISALQQHEMGYSWNDLRPGGVSAIAWYSLYDAYLRDEEENDGWKAKKLAEIERETRGRISDETGFLG